MSDSARYFEYIDKYCERTAEGLWAEPLNVISNIAFFIVAILLFRFYRQHFKGKFIKYWDISLLIALMFFITGGSTLWHVYSLRWALYTDAIPILIFINVFLLSCFVRILGLSVSAVILLFLLYQLFNYGIQLNFSMDTLNGSIFYLPVWIFITGILFFACRNRDGLCHYYLISVGLFSAALVLRTFDISQCDNFPTGTHFLWHILIATMLFFLTKSLMLSQLIPTVSVDMTDKPGVTHKS